MFLQGREMDTRTTVFKKTDEMYQLKMKASRGMFIVPYAFQTPFQQILYVVLKSG